jgi:HK97 family phage major capsid protein
MAEAVTDRQKELEQVMDAAKKLQDFYDEVDPDTKRKSRWDPEDRKKFDALCEEGFALQEEIESEQKMDQLETQGRRLREVPEPTLPNARSHAKTDVRSGSRDIAGYVSIGDMAIFAEEFQKFAQGQYARGQHAIIQISAALNGKNVVRGMHGEALVPLTRDMRKGYEQFLQSKSMKAVPTLGVGVLEPERLTRIPQVTGDERMTIRDVISTGQTSASSVEYVREESFSMLAAPTAHGVEKPEEDLEYSLQAAPVRTIAGWMPVQSQQLEDWAQLRSLIDGRLRYSVARNEEEQIMYGNGNPPNIEGILAVAGTQNIATNGRYIGGTHTLIDVVRMGITDVLVAGYQANAVVIHPFDWESIILEKGSDNRYVWVVVQDATGPRIWGVRVVESIGAQSRVTGARNLVVGDWVMGAQLLDRMQTTIQIGLIDRQLIENMRTLLAEERIALPIYAPAGFAFFQSAAGS